MGLDSDLDLEDSLIRCYDCSNILSLSEIFEAPERSSLSGYVGVCFFCAQIRGVVE